MPVNNTKGLVTNELLFEEDFESGSLASWDYVSPGVGVDLSTLQAQGTYSLRTINPVPDAVSPAPWTGASVAYKYINLYKKIRTISFKFYVQAYGVDDPGFFSLRSTDQAFSAMTLIPFRQTDPTRRWYLNGQLYSVLNTGEWYTMNITNFTNTTPTMDFELRDSGATLIDSDTDVPTANIDVNTIAMANQLGDSDGVMYVDDIQIWGKGI